MKTLLLRYEAVGSTFNGTVFYENATVASFVNLSFNDLILSLADCLVTLEREGKEVEEAQLQRTEIEATFPMGSDFIEALRVDPLRAVDLLSPAPVTFGKRKRVETIYSDFRVGHDTLAAALGDDIYLRCKGTKVEDPFTGRWVGLLRGVRYMNMDPEPLCIIYSKDSKNFELTGYQVKDRWFKVATESLLLSGMPRYFIPREWNLDGPWITHEELQAKYNQYLKEKANV